MNNDYGCKIELRNELSMHWVSVKEKLPNNYYYVLGWIAPPKHNIVYVHRVYRHPDCWIWRDMNDNEFEITYWMKVYIPKEDNNIIGDLFKI